MYPRGQSPPPPGGGPGPSAPAAAWSVPMAAGRGQSPLCSARGLTSPRTLSLPPCPVPPPPRHPARGSRAQSLRVGRACDHRVNHGLDQGGPAHGPAPGHFSGPDPQRPPEPDQPSLPLLQTPPRPSLCPCDPLPVPACLPASVSPLVSSAQGLCSPPTQTSPGRPPGLEQTHQPP